MKVLVVKTSSLGDVVHTLPALTDAARALAGIRFDWVVEQAYAEIPRWHPSVDRVIPIELRRWRRHPFRAETRRAWRTFRALLADTHYDRIIDAQGLLKSAVLTLFACGPRWGLDRRSAWEPPASLAYRHRVSVTPEQHAITRMRQLFAGALGYRLDEDAPDYGLDLRAMAIEDHPAPPERRFIVFLHGTTWRSKEWPEPYWIALGRLADQAGFDALLPWHGDTERQRAGRIAETLDNARVLAAMNLREIAATLALAAGVVGVDTGLSQLSAALGIPAVTLYGATHADLTGALGDRQVNLNTEFACSPCLRRTCRYRGPEQPRPACYTSLPPERVWRALRPMLVVPERSPRRTSRDRHEGNTTAPAG